MATLETPRLICIPLKEDHAKAMFAVLQDANLYRHIADRPPESIEALRHRYRTLAIGRSADGSETWLNWVLFLKSRHEPIGYYQATVRTHALIAYVIHSSFWHRGFAKEAGQSVLSYLFDTYPINEVRAAINQHNAASIKLANRLGFSFKAYNGTEKEMILPRHRFI